MVIEAAPTSLCASIAENALYLVQMFEGKVTVYMARTFYKYNVETKMLPYSSLLAADKSVYGAGVQSTKWRCIYYLYRRRMVDPPPY